MHRHLKKISLSVANKKILETVSGQNIYLKNVFGVNQIELDKLMEQGRVNAEVYLSRHKQGQTLSIFEEQNLFNSLVEIKNKLNLVRIPKHIECYDISHFAGRQVYGSMITFIDGRPVTRLYRLFRTAQKNDDFANLQEVLTRRFQNWVKNLQTEKKLKINSATKPQTMTPWSLPDLMIIDGGKGQLSATLSVLEKFQKNYPQIQVEICSLAKQEEEVFLPRQSESIKFTGQTKFLLQRIRDEAHRFGITNQRKATIKKSIVSNLDTIPGIGKITRQKLLGIFGSLDNLIENYYTNPQSVQEILTTRQFNNFTNWLKQN